MIFTLILLNVVGGLGMLVGTTATANEPFAIIMQVLLALLFFSNAGVIFQKRG